MKGGDEGNRVGALEGGVNARALRPRRKRIGSCGEGGEIPAPVGDRALDFSGLRISFLPLFFISFFLMFP